LPCRHFSGKSSRRRRNLKRRANLYRQRNLGNKLFEDISLPKKIEKL